MSRKLSSISRADLPNRHSSMAERGWNCADWCISPFLRCAYSQSVDMCQRPAAWFTSRARPQGNQCPPKLHSVPGNDPGVLRVEPSFGTLFCLYFKHGNRGFLQALLQVWCPPADDADDAPTTWLASDPKSSTLGGFGCLHLLSPFRGDSSTWIRPTTPLVL